MSKPQKPTEAEVQALRESILQQTGFDLLPASASMALQDAQRARREAEANPYGVKVGQVWQDNDKRSSYRKGRVIEVTEEHARMDWGATKTRVSLSRFKPTNTGYRLIQDVM